MPGFRLKEFILKWILFGWLINFSKKEKESNEKVDNDVKTDKNSQKISNIFGNITTYNNKKEIHYHFYHGEKNKPDIKPELLESKIEKEIKSSNSFIFSFDKKSQTWKVFWEYKKKGYLIPAELEEEFVKLIVNIVKRAEWYE